MFTLKTLMLTALKMHYSTTPSGAPEFIPGFQQGSRYSIFSLMCLFCRLLFVLFFLPLCCLYCFDIWILIVSFVSSNSSPCKYKYNLIIHDTTLPLHAYNKCKQCIFCLFFPFCPIYANSSLCILCHIELRNNTFICKELLVSWEYEGGQ